MKFISKLIPVMLLPALLLSQTSLFAQTSQQLDEIATIRDVITTTQPNLPVEDIVPSPVEGLYEITVKGGQVIYASSDARFFIPGDLYEAMPGGLVNRGEEKRNVIRAEKIAAVPESEMIIFEPDSGRKATITVFTDVDCPYCRQLHSEIDRFMELGIAIRYLAYPRTGLKDANGMNTPTYDKMIGTWCAGDPNATFTSATRGGKVPEAVCDNPIARQYQLGREVGVTGTPALVLQDGSILPGYVPADTLAEYLLGTPSE